MGKVGTEATLQDILGQADAAVAYLDILANGTTVKTWEGFKKLVNMGVASNNYPVGSQIFDTWYKDANTSYQTPWDITSYDNEGVFLNWHFATPDGVPFDEPEAIYYAGSSGLAAGTYHILIGTAYGDGWSTSKSIQFTLNSAMEENDQLVINCGTANSNDPTNGRTWNVYAKGSTTSKDTGTTSNGTDGTSLGTIGATSAHAPDTEHNLNAISRVVYGYNRWKQSAWRQWANSESAAGAWWSAQNPWDRPPSVASTMRGFFRQLQPCKPLASAHQEIL